MATIEKVSIALTSEQLGALKAAVETGEYATTSEAVREAIRDWMFRRRLRGDEVARVRALWDEGLASGSAGAVDMDALRLEAREALKAVRRDG